MNIMKMKMLTISFAAIIGLFGIIEVEATPTGENFGIHESNNNTDIQELLHLGYQDGKFRLNVLGNVYEVQSPFGFGAEDAGVDGIIPSTKNHSSNQNRINCSADEGENVLYKPKTSLFQELLNLFGMNKVLCPSKETQETQSLINDTKNNVFIPNNNLSNDTESNLDITEDDTNITSYQFNNNQSSLSPNQDEVANVINILNQSSNDNLSVIIDPNMSIKDDLNENENINLNDASTLNEEVFNQTSSRKPPTDNVNDINKLFVKEESNDNESIQELLKADKKKRNKHKSINTPESVSNKKKSSSKYHLDSNTPENVGDQMGTTIKSGYHSNKKKIKQ